MYRLRLGPILADAQSASLRKIHSSRHIGPFPARPSVLGSPLEGRALHAPNIRIATYRDISPFGHQLLAKSSVIMLCPGLRPALQTDAQGAPLREHRPPRYPRVFPRKAILARITNPAEGRAPHARGASVREDRLRDSPCTMTPSQSPGDLAPREATVSFP